MFKTKRYKTWLDQSANEDIKKVTFFIDDVVFIAVPHKGFQGLFIYTESTEQAKLLARSGYKVAICPDTKRMVDATEMYFEVVKVYY